MSPKAWGNAVPGKTAGMERNQAKFSNTGMRSGGNTWKGLDVDQGDSREFQFQFIHKTPRMGFASWQDQEERWEHREGEGRGGGVHSLDSGVGNCVDPDRIHHSKMYPMHHAPLPQKNAGKKGAKIFHDK